MSLALTFTERRWAHDVFGAIFPRPSPGAGRALPVGIEDLDLDGFLDDTMTALPFESKWGIRLALWVIALAPLFVLGKLATISSLLPADREKAIALLAASRMYIVRSTVLMVKAMGALFYCGDARLRPALLSAGRPSVAPLVPLAPPSAFRLRASSPPTVSAVSAVPADQGAADEPHRRSA